MHAVFTDGRSEPQPSELLSPGPLTAHLEGGVAIIDLRGNHRSACTATFNKSLSAIALLIKSHQTKVINELLVYGFI